jgi:hypothetical protein
MLCILIRHSNSPYFSRGSAFLQSFVGIETALLSRQWVMNKEEINVIYCERSRLDIFSRKETYKHTELEFTQRLIDAFQRALVAVILRHTLRSYIIHNQTKRKKVYSVLTDENVRSLKTTFTNCFANCRFISVHLSRINVSKVHYLAVSLA